MNAIEFLVKEHNKVRRVLAEIADDTHREATKRKLFIGLSKDLIRHETMEQKVWYPHFRNNKKLKKELRHLLSEEKHAEKAIKKLMKAKSPQEWDKQFAKFKKDVEHHAKEEERDLFPNVEDMLSDAELKLIGTDMYHFKKAYNKRKGIKG